MHRYLIILMLWASGHVSAHEFTPTYPKLKTSYVEGVLYATMTLFNARDDVEYYQFGVLMQSGTKYRSQCKTKL